MPANNRVAKRSCTGPKSRLASQLHASLHTRCEKCGDCAELSAYRRSGTNVDVESSSMAQGARVLGLCACRSIGFPGAGDSTLAAVAFGDGSAIAMPWRLHGPRTLRRNSARTICGATL